MEPRRPDKLTRWQRWRIVFYGFVGIVVFCFLAWGYLKYCEYRDWGLIDELLAEQDVKHPHWRWHEFMPKPLHPGQINGAMLFIEVGKQLTEEMLAQPDYPDKDSLGFQMFTREWLTTIDRDSVRASGRQVREKCKHLESILPNLVELQPGCPPISINRPSAKDFFTGEKSQLPLLCDEAAYNRARRWLFRLFKFHMDEGNGDQAIQAWRALLSFDQCQIPGMMSGLNLSRHFQNFRDFNACYQMLAKTQPTEPSLHQLQQIVTQWRTQLITLDDVHMDRAFAVQLLVELRDESKSAFLTGLHQMYAKPPKWMPEDWQGITSKLGIGSPSLPYIFRMEILTNMQLFDSFEQQLKARKPYLSLDVFDDDEMIAGKHFATYFLPRWKKMIADQRSLYDNLLCLEALIAAERYRLKHGDYPKRWNELVPSFLKERPKSGEKPFTIKPVPEGLVIYLPGDKDHGGKVLRIYHPVTDKLDTDTDQGLMIFYPKYRRQSPPPVKPKTKEEEP